MEPSNHHHSQGTKVIHKLTLDLARGENAYDAVRAAVPDRELKKKFTVQNQYGSHGNNVIANTFGSRQAVSLSFSFALMRVRFLSRSLSSCPLSSFPMLDSRTNVYPGRTPFS